MSWEGKHLSREDSKRNDYGKVWAKPEETFYELRVFERYRLEYGQVPTDCELFHRGRRNFLSASARLIGRRHDSDDIVPVLEQDIQARE